MGAAPTLADLLLRAAPKDRRAPLLRRAQSFVFDAEASAFLGEMLGKVGRLILREHDAARPPFPLTWVEFDGHAYSVGIDGYVRNPDTADTKFGFLYDGSTAYLGSINDEHRAAWVPLELHLHRRASVEAACARLPGFTPKTYRMALLGHVEPLGESWWDSPEAADICANHRLVLTEERLDAAMRVRIVRSCQGVLKQALAGLLVLTRPGQRVLSMGDEGRHRGMLRGRPHLYVAHRKVTLHVERKIAIRRFVTGIHTGLHRRRHDVRGHWAQTRRRQMACEHVWDPVDADHWRCTRCEAKRWWRKSHRRGSLEEGVISHEYVVKR